jgi:glutamate synthase (NADPH/NADH) small chain
LLTTHNSQLATEIAKRFPDLHPALEARAAVVAANRCLNCFDAPCMGACPTHIDVPGFIRRIAEGNVTGAAKTILGANILGASCARACPVDVLCEGACVLHAKHERPVEISRLQRFAVESFYNAGGRLTLGQRKQRCEQVTCIGAGPASLSCAAELRQLGFRVRVIERRELPGGLNTYGIAEYKLRVADSLREAEMVRGLGVEFETREVDAAALAEIERTSDAVFLGVGLGAMHRLEIAGVAKVGAERIVDALRFIACYKSGSPLNVGRRVVVIGVGNTAIDAACAARRLGAESVTILYRRGREQASAFDFEIEHAMREGVEFVWHALPVSIAETADELALNCIATVQDKAGQLTLVAGSEFTIECDAVIPAIGQSPRVELLSQILGLTMERGCIAIDRATGQSANPKYFAGGDCVNGGREVVDAVADGKRAAQGIAAWLDERQRSAPSSAQTEVAIG